MSFAASLAARRGPHAKVGAFGAFLACGSSRTGTEVKAEAHTLAASLRTGTSAHAHKASRKLNCIATSFRFAFRLLFCSTALRLSKGSSNVCAGLLLLLKLLLRLRLGSRLRSCSSCGALEVLPGGCRRPLPGHHGLQEIIAGNCFLEGCVAGADGTAAAFDSIPGEVGQGHPKLDVGVEDLAEADCLEASHGPLGEGRHKLLSKDLVVFKGQQVCHFHRHASTHVGVDEVELGVDRRPDVISNLL